MAGRVDDIAIWPRRRSTRFSPLGTGSRCSMPPRTVAATADALPAAVPSSKPPTPRVSERRHRRGTALLGGGDLRPTLQHGRGRRSVAGTRVAGHERMRANARAIDPMPVAGSPGRRSRERRRQRKACRCRRGRRWLCRRGCRGVPVPDEHRVDEGHRARVLHLTRFHEPAAEPVRAACALSAVRPSCTSVRWMRAAKRSAGGRVGICDRIPRPAARSCRSSRRSTSWSMMMRSSRRDGRSSRPHRCAPPGGTPNVISSGT